MKCPSHNSEMKLLTDESGKQTLYVCGEKNCGWQFCVPWLAKPSCASPSAQYKALVKATEHEVEECVDRGLMLLGHTNLSTSIRLKTFDIECPVCKSSFKHRPNNQASFGTSPGVPDRLVAPQWLPPYLFIGIELKGDTTKVSDAQKELARVKRISVCRDWESVQSTIEFVKQRLSLSL